MVLLAGCGIQTPPSTPESKPSPPPATGGTNASQSAESPDQAALNQSLRDAAWRSNTRDASSLIEQGADVNAKDNTSQSAYLIATSNADLPFLRLMLAKGADVKATDSWGGTGLTRAAERGNYLIVGALLKAGVDPSHVNTLGYQAIHEAVWLGQDTDDYVDTVRVMSAAGVNLETTSDNEDLTALQMTMDRGFTRLETTLRSQLEGEKQASPDAALLAAVEKDDADAAARALRDGAGLNTPASGGKVPLRVALDGKRDATLRLLIALGANAGATDDAGDTPLMIAAAHGDANLVTLMSTAPGLDLNTRDAQGRTALMRAVAGGDGSDRFQRVVRALLEAGADPAVTDRDGATASALAQAAGQEEIVTILNTK